MTEHKRVGQRTCMRLSALFVVTLAAAAPAVADTTDFQPSIFLGWRYTDNVRYLEDAGQRSFSDSSTRLNVVLPVTRRLKRGQFAFSYNGSYTKYQKADDLDFDAHDLRLSWDAKPDRRSSMGMTARYSLTQEQANPIDATLTGFTVSRRTDRATAAVNFNYRRQLAKRWDWGAGAAVEDSRFDPIPGFDTGTVVLDVEDRTSYRATLSTSRAISRRARLGGTYGFDRFSLDRSGREDVHRLGVVINYTPNEWFGIGLRLGGYTRSRERDTGQAIRDDGVDVGLDLNLGRAFSRAMRKVAGPVKLGLDVGITPTSGGSLEGTSTDGYIGFSLFPSEEYRGPIGWWFGTRYTRRQPVIRENPTVDTVGVSGSIEKFFGSWLGLRLTASWADQSSEQETGTGTRSLQGSFYSTGLNLVWYPTRLNRR